ncbi:MAG: D-alanine--D-alanine ligase [Gemmataceae bacterium]|nr:D-alanine--D-alanine ligase [Gemmataceae bacterium]
MRIGLAVNLKSDALRPTGLVPDDWDEEFDSPETVEALSAVMRSMGHDPVVLGDGEALIRRVLDQRPDFVFNIAEGAGIGRSREARVPAVLEMLGIPYSGSDPLTLAASLDKAVARRLVEGGAVRIPRGFVVEGKDTEQRIRDLAKTVVFPVVVKPAWEGSSKGIRARCLVDDAQTLVGIVQELWQDYSQSLLVEEFVGGAELTIGMVGNGVPRILGVMEVVPLKASDRFIYSLEVKRNWRECVRYESPARLLGPIQKQIESAALEAWDRLGCRDLCRMDFRLNGAGEPVFIEANPLPGLNPVTSDLVILAAGVGVSHDQLIREVLTAGLSRVGLV